MVKVVTSKLLAERQIVRRGPVTIDRQARTLRRDEGGPWLPFQLDLTFSSPSLLPSPPPRNF